MCGLTLGATSKCFVWVLPGGTTYRVLLGARRSAEAMLTCLAKDCSAMQATRRSFRVWRPDLPNSGGSRRRFRDSKSRPGASQEGRSSDSAPQSC